MVYIGTKLPVIDNSGARLVKCIRIYGKLSLSRGCVGDLVLFSVRKINPKKKIKRGEVFRGFLIRCGSTLFRYGGVYIKFFNRGLILLNKRENLLGTRVLEPIAYELRNRNQFRLVALAPAII